MNNKPSTMTPPNSFQCVPFLKEGEQESDFEEVSPFPKSPAKHSFISEDRVGNGIKMKYFRRKVESNILLVRCFFGPETEGPPGFSHGGSQAALLDEVMGASAWILGLTVLAAKIEVQFRRSLPLNTIVTGEAEIEKRDGKKIFVKGKIMGDDGTLYAESTGLFVEIDILKKLKTT